MNLVTRSRRGIYSFVVGIAALVAIAVAPHVVHGQNFEKGLELYQQEQYQQAATAFDNVDSPKARLFSGKSYFALGQYLKAKSYLNKVGSSAPRDLILEKEYTLALVDFQLKQFDLSLNRLYELSQTDIRTQVVTDGIRFYNNILNYLTLEQRRKAFQGVKYDPVKFDLIKSAFGKVDYNTAKVLLSQYRKVGEPGSASSDIANLEKLIADSLSYATKMTFGKRLKAPDGIAYNIGAALPEYKKEDKDFGISRGLYFGYLMAAEDFNKGNKTKKALFRFKNTAGTADSSEHIMTDFAWNYQADAIIGPLFSEPAKRMAELAELYEIPMLAPLANSDTLNIDNPYVYQANPSFASHGKKMAQFAVKRLGMDTLAVLAEKGSLGAASAFAFRDEAERLGAKITHFFVDDLKSKGYEIGEYTRQLGPGRPAKKDAPQNKKNNKTRAGIDGVYAPFTGQAAPTLIDLLTIDLEAMDSDLTVLGSQEWGAAATDIPENRLTGRKIFFSESYFMNKKSDRYAQFANDFADRFGIEPNRFALIGYDTASYLLQALERVENPSLLKKGLGNQPLYQGLIGNIRFDGSHVNQEVKIFRISDQGVRPVK